MQLDGPWLVPSTSQSGKKAMKNKSRRHLLRASALPFIIGRQQSG
jgi:hypothetical protein